MELWFVENTTGQMFEAKRWKRVISSPRFAIVSQFLLILLFVLSILLNQTGV
jgi:hypothetical protein